MVIRMYAPRPNISNPLNLSPQAQDIARRSGNERLVFWTSVVSLGFMGVMATAMTAQVVFDMVRRGGHRHHDEPGTGGGTGRGSER